MKPVLLIIELILVLPAFLSAQYATPGTGVYWSFDSLQVHGSGTVTVVNDSVFINEALFISAMDTLKDDGRRVFFTQTGTAAEVTVNGSFIVTGCSFDHADSSLRWSSLRFEGGSSLIEGCTLQRAETGITISAGQLSLGNSEIGFCSDTGIRLAGSADAQIEYCTVHDNDGYGIHITSEGAVMVRESIIENNSKIKSGRPGVFIFDASPQLIGNEIVNNSWQGVGIWQQFGTALPVIDSNLVAGNLSGITIVNASPLIRFNEIINNFQPGNFESGAGVFIGFSQANPVLYKNTISGNHFGIALQNNGRVICGDLADSDSTHHGYNRILGNKFGSTVYDFFNETSLDQKAENNYWGTDNADSIAAHIVDAGDEPGYGVVDFMPYLPHEPLSVANNQLPFPEYPVLVRAYPNPFNSRVRFRIEGGFRMRFSDISVFDLTGRKLRTLRLYPTKNGLETSWDSMDRNGRTVASGIYIWKLSSPGQPVSGRIILIK